MVERDRPKERVEIELDGKRLTREQVLVVARDVRAESVRIAVGPEARERVEACAKYVRRKVAAGDVVYGVTTGFGRNATRTVDEAYARDLQRNLILSHTSGLGDPLPTVVVRAMMLIRVSTLLRGHSGIRIETVQALVDLLNAGVHPIVPRFGSVGASGDLAPLSHVAAVALGEGQAELCGDVLPGAEALLRAGLRPVELSYKEGLALNNGTTLMTALAVLSLDGAERCAALADITGTLALEALAARGAAFDDDVHALLRGHPGQVLVARNVRELTAGSSLVDLDPASVPTYDAGEPPRGKPPRTQDAYSFRCLPQVHGAVRDTLAHVRGIVDRELVAVTDNPLIFPERDAVISAGNFHGMPVALALSCIKVALTPLAAIAERRIAALVDDATNDGLPRFLVRDERGIDSGVMMLQYTAAALVNDLATRAHPATAYSVPTSANTEDYVSMGATEGLHALDMTREVEDVLALEVIVAAQAADVRCQLLDGTFPREVAKAESWPRMGEISRLVQREIRQTIPFVVTDVELRPLIERARSLVASDRLIAVAEHALGRKL